MQSILSTLPLGAVRAFEAAGRLGSIKAAAQQLGVTPAAVSRQIQALERFLGTALFRRGHNSIELTASGALLLADASPALAALAGAAARIRRDALEAVVSVSVTFGSRWLIPRLAGLQARYPQIALRLAMHNGRGDANPDADLTVHYVREEALRGMAGERVLFRDVTIPACGPALLAKLRAGGRPSAWWRQPLLSGTADDWDWRTWALSSGFDPQRLKIRHRLDTDDATMGGAMAGIGVALVSLPLALDAFRDGRLFPVPGVPAVPIGGYALDLAAPAERRAVTQFTAWLKKAVAKTRGEVGRFVADQGITLVSDRP